MNITATLHKISHLKWVFLIAEVFLIFYAFTISTQSESLIAVIGMIILVAGIQLGLESLSDVKKISKKEIKNYRNDKNVKAQFTYILIAIIFLAIISLLFFSLKIFGSSRNEQMFKDFFNLGLNLWALILGLLCLLKSIHDKYDFVNSQIKK